MILTAEKQIIATTYEEHVKKDHERALNGMQKLELMGGFQKVDSYKGVPVVYLKPGEGPKGWFPYQWVGHWNYTLDGQLTIYVELAELADYLATNTLESLLIHEWMEAKIAIELVCGDYDTPERLLEEKGVNAYHVVETDHSYGGDAHEMVVQMGY